MKQLMKALEEARAKLVKVDPSNPIEPVEPQQPEDSKDETNTGDVSNMAGILTLMLVSGAGVVLLKRKSRQ